MRQKTITSYADLLNSLTTLLVKGPGPRVIGIDGAMCLGKTPLANQLAADLRRPVFHLDDYHSHDGSPYVQKVDLVRLSVDIDRAIRSSGYVILEGICLLDVLHSLDGPSHILVFMVPEPRSIYADFIDPERTEEEILQTLGTADAAALDREIARYQRRAKPQEQAHVIYCQWAQPTEARH